MGIRFGKKCQCCNSFLSLIFILIRLSSLAAFFYFVCPQIIVLAHMTFHTLPNNGVWTQLNEHKSTVNLVVCWLTWLAIVLFISFSSIALVVSIIVISCCEWSKGYRVTYTNFKGWISRSIGEFILGSSRHIVAYNYEYMDD